MDRRTLETISQEDLQNALDKAIAYVREWVELEREHYSDVKFGELRRVEIKTIIDDPHLESNPHVLHGIGDYIKRAELIGLDTMRGRQALAKAMVTIESLLADSVIAYGNLPEPGHSSTEDVKLWKLWDETPQD